jgi:hypothetical protein
MKNTFYLILLLITSSLLSIASTPKAPHAKASEKAYAKFPYWIQMMEDEKANYFEAQKSFEIFWAKREKPLEEKEILGDKNEEYSKDAKALAKRMKKLPAESQNLAFQYKKFLYWSREVKPYVQEDGSILSKVERLKISSQNP